MPLLGLRGLTLLGHFLATFGLARPALLILLDGPVEVGQLAIEVAGHRLRIRIPVGGALVNRRVEDAIDVIEIEAHNLSFQPAGMQKLDVASRQMILMIRKRMPVDNSVKIGDDMGTTVDLSRNVPRLGLNRSEVALAIGVSVNTVDLMVEEGFLPRPRKWHSRKVWLVGEMPQRCQSGQRTGYRSTGKTSTTVTTGGRLHDSRGEYRTAVC